MNPANFARGPLGGATGPRGGCGYGHGQASYALPRCLMGGQGWMVKDMFGMPTAAFQVSGEYAMIAAAAERGWLDERAAFLESLTCIKRAGADLIITNWAKEFASL